LALRMGVFLAVPTIPVDRRTIPPNEQELADRDVQQFFEMSLDHLVVAGYDGYFKRLNPAWTRTFGWTVAELLARPSLEFVHPLDRERTLAARNDLIDRRAPLTGLTNRYLCKDGSFRWLQWMSVAYPDRGLVYAAARDVTDQRHAEQAAQEVQGRLILAERMATVGRLAAGVAHEINNPLVAVLANLEMIQADLLTLGDGEPEKLRELAELVGEALAGAVQVRNIVRGLRNLSRTEDDQLSITDIRDVLDLAVAMVGHDVRDRARLRTDYGQTPLIEADPARLGQVFINLLVNATQAIPQGHVDANEIRLTTWTDSTGAVVVEVRDSGPGMDAATMGRIFDPFFTTRPVGSGTGLGLSLCHTIVTGLGGSISVTSEQGHGAAFRVVLPPAPEAT
jgi:PAS domain S-box-containing protein